MTTTAASGMPSALEPLRALSRFAWDWAPSLCSTDHGCQDYHRAWSLVRLLEMEGLLPNGAAFIERQSAALAAEGRTRVLVSGGADTGVTALVVRGFRAHGVEPDIVFMDRCATPCRQNELFAKAAGFRLAAVQCDAREIDVPPVDAVIAHSFLQMLPGEARPAVVAAWSRLLRPGGVVWLSSFLAEREDDVGRRKDASRIEERRRSLERAALGEGWAADELQALGASATRFWMRSVSQKPGLTEEGLRALFAGAGLTIRVIESQESSSSPVSLGSTEPARRRVHIAAVRD